MTALTSLIVRLKTSTRSGSATDDDVYFSIGTREWRLDNNNHNDFEKGNRDIYVLQNIAGLNVEDIQFIRLQKTGTDGWRPDSIEVFVNDPRLTKAPLYSGKINVMLDGGKDTAQRHGLFWQASDFPKRWPFDFDVSGTVDPAVTSLIVQITTSNSIGANTNDRVYFNIGTREWRLDNSKRDDFERGQTDTFVLQNLAGLKMSDIQQIGLRKFGRNSWRPGQIRVWVNSDIKGTPFFQDRADIWLNGNATSSDNKRSYQWASRNYPQPAASPVTDKLTALKVVIKTANVRNAGTQGRVYLDIGTRGWLLRNGKQTIFRRNNTDTFILKGLQDMGGLRLSDIRKVGLYMGSEDGWQPEKIQLFVNNETTPFYEGTINTRLESGEEDHISNQFGRRWEAPDFIWDVPVHCHFVVSQTNPSIRPQRNRQACAELVENLNTATYRSRQGAANSYWTQGRVKFRITGFSNAQVRPNDARIMPFPSRTNLTMSQYAARFNKAGHLNIYFVQQIQGGSNWHVPGPDIPGTSTPANPSCWVKDTRRSNRVNTSPNFQQVAISLSHEIGHYLGLRHVSGNTQRIMTGSGTTARAQLITRSEARTVRPNAAAIAENRPN